MRLQHPKKALKIYHIIIDVNKFFLIMIRSKKKCNPLNRFIFLLIILLDEVLFWNFDLIIVKISEEYN